MKILSLKLDDETFEAAAAITAELKLARNSYIKEAVDLYNKFKKRKLREILVDQISSIENKRLIQKLGKLNQEQIRKLKQY